MENLWETCWLKQIKIKHGIFRKLDLKQVSLIRAAYQQTKRFNYVSHHINGQ